MAWPPSMPSSDATLPPLEAALDVVGGQRQRQAVGVARDHPPGDVELLQLHLGIPAVLDLARDVDRPELGPHLALGQPGQVGVPGVSGSGGRRPPRPAAPSRTRGWSQGRSLCPSMSGVERRSFLARSSALILWTGRGAGEGMRRVRSKR